MSRRELLVALSALLLLLVGMLLYSRELGGAGHGNATILVPGRDISFYPYLNRAEGVLSVKLFERILGEARKLLLQNNLFVVGERAGLVRGLVLNASLVNDSVLGIRGKLFYFVVLVARYEDKTIINDYAFLGPGIVASLKWNESGKNIWIEISNNPWICKTPVPLREYVDARSASKPTALGEDACTNSAVVVVLSPGNSYVLAVLRPVRSSFP